MRGPFQSLKLERVYVDLSLLVSALINLVRTQATEDARYRREDDVVIPTPEHPDPPPYNSVSKNNLFPQIMSSICVKH